jgi:hypothetical protein
MSNDNQMPGSASEPEAAAVDIEAVKTEAVPQDNTDSEISLLSVFWAGIDPLIMGYNSYVIAYNILIEDGYWAVFIGLAINIWILICYQQVLEGIFSKLYEKIKFKLSSKLAYLVLAIAVLFGVLIAFKGVDNLIEDSAVPLVSEIIKKELGANAAVCKKVEIEKEISPNLYRAKAILNNGSTIKIVIEIKGENMQICIPEDQ